MNKLNPSKEEITPSIGDKKGVKELMPKAESAIKTPVVKQFQILIVDDDSTFSNAIKSMIENRHKESIGEIIVLSDFMEAVRMVQRHRFDLIVTDMKDYNGNDMGSTVVRFAKRANKETYVIGMSSAGASRKLFNEAGADDFIDKAYMKIDGSQILDKFFKKN